MDILNGIKNFLSLINDNWTTILVIVGLALALWKKIESYSKLSTNKKIEIAKKQISENILKLITQAEKDYAEWEKAGSIKRSEVISEIYKEWAVVSGMACLLVLLSSVPGGLCRMPGGFSSAAIKYRLSKG